MNGPADATATVTVRLFAQLRAAAGTDVVRLDVPSGSDVRALAARLEADHPGLTLRGAMVAIDEAYAPPETPLRGGETVAFLPPVSGG